MPTLLNKVELKNYLKEQTGVEPTDTMADNLYRSYSYAGRTDDTLDLIVMAYAAGLSMAPAVMARKLDGLAAEQQGI